MENNRSSKQIKPVEWLANMGWFSRLILVGAIMMLIDSMFELYTNIFAPYLIIFCIVIIISTSQIQDDCPQRLLFTLLVLVLNFFNQVQFHSFIGVNWIIGIGYIGNILINLGATLALLFIILGVAASDNQDPIRDLWLYLIGFIMIGGNLIMYLVLTDFTLTQTTMLAVFYFSMVVICTILELLGQKIITSFTIWILTFINAFGGDLATPISGFGAGMAIVGNIALLYFINDLGLKVAMPKEKEILD